MTLTQSKPKLYICVKRGFLGKTDQSKLCPSIVSHHAKIFGRSRDIRSNNVGANWAQIVLLLEKGIFWENWLMLLLSTYCAPLCYKVSKNSLALGRSWGIRCCSFGPNWTQITDLPLKKSFFWKNWLMLILSTSWTYQTTTMFGKTSLKWITK